MISNELDIENDQSSDSEVLTNNAISTSMGFTIKQYYREPSGNYERIASQHIVQLNFDVPIALSWKSNNTRTAGLCYTGNIVQLLSNGDKDDLKCDPPHKILELTFDPSFINTLLECANFRFRKLQNVFDPQLNEIVQELNHCLYSGQTEKIYAESLGVACAIHLTTTYPESEKKLFAPKGKLSSNQLRTIIEFVRSSIHEVICLEELAASVHLSVFHFSRLFKNTVGISPYQFVLRMKIEFSKNLIKRKQPIGDIAYSLGFTDSAHFCNAFKKLTGLSPLQSCTASLPIDRMLNRPFANNNGTL